MTVSRIHVAPRFAGALITFALLVVLGATLAPPAQAAPGLLWSTPLQIDGAPPFSTGNLIGSMSCPSASLCVGADFEGNVHTSTDPAGGVWTRTSITGPEQLINLDCASATQCVAVTRYGELITTTNPTGGAAAWATAKVGSHFISDVSCPTESFCMAVGDEGRVLTSTNPTGGVAAWTESRVASSPALWRVSCPAPTLCVAIDQREQILTSTDPAGGAGTWKAASFPGVGFFMGISCASTTLCVAVAPDGMILTSTNPTGGAAAWTTTTFGNADINDVDCPSTTFCAAITGVQAITTTNPAGGAGTWSATEVGSTASVGCASAALCVAGGNFGEVFASTGGAWSRELIAGINRLTDVDCVSASFCAATDEAGRVLTTNNVTGGAWTGRLAATGRVLKRISCPSASLCLTIDGAGNLLWSSDPTGAAPWSVAKLAPTGTLTAISCPSAFFCAAVSDDGYVYTSTNPTGGAATWSRFAKHPGLKLLSVSCASGALCAVGDAGGGVMTSSNPTGGSAAWTRIQVDNAGFSDLVGGVSCPTTTFCAALTGDGYVHVSTTPGAAAPEWTHTRISDRSVTGGISCVSSTFCVATGYSLAHSSTQPTVASSWAVREANLPGHRLTGIDCVSTTLCVAVNSSGMVMTSSPAPPKTLTVAQAGTGSGTVTSAPAGIACGATCSHVFEDGTRVTLTATPAVGSRFTGWSGACSGTGTCQVELVAAASVTAGFAATPSLTVSKAGAGSGSVTSAPAGIDCGATCSAAYPFGTTVTLTATAASGSGFTGWSGACTGTGTCEVTVSEATAVTATFAVQHTLSVATRNGSGRGRVTSPNGINCSGTCAYDGNDGTTTTVTATPDPGSRFAGWSGGTCSGTDPCTFTLDGDRTIVALFIGTPTLTVATAGTGAGSVTSDIGGIDCGTTCSAVYESGNSITLTATPAPGSVFTGWSFGLCPGTGPCTVTMSGNGTVTATFAAKPTLRVATTGSGQVKSDGGGIDCGATCSAVLDPGASVTLTATAASGWSFSGWSGGGCSGTQPCKVTVNESTAVSATFVADPEPTPTATPTPTPAATEPPTPPATPQPGVNPGPGTTPKPAVPDTRLLKTTLKASKRTAKFTFKAAGTATGYRCALTARGKKIVYKTCRSPVTFKKLKKGRYTFRVLAVGPGGADRTPATKTITIKSHARL